jgi:hypothetical protein
MGVSPSVFQNGRLLRGRDAEGFEKFEPGLKAKGK